MVHQKGPRPDRSSCNKRTPLQSTRGTGRPARAADYLSKTTVSNDLERLRVETKRISLWSKAEATWHFALQQRKKSGHRTYLEILQPYLAPRQGTCNLSITIRTIFTRNLFTLLVGFLVIQVGTLRSVVGNQRPSAVLTWRWHVYIYCLRWS